MEGEMDAANADVDMARADEDASKLQELDEMKKRLKEMEEEAAALREMQAKVEKEMSAVQDPASSAATQASREEVDSRSVFVGNSDVEKVRLKEDTKTLQKFSIAMWGMSLDENYGLSLVAIGGFYPLLHPPAISYDPFCVSLLTQVARGDTIPFEQAVDYACTPEEVQQHFQSCGTVNRVTILTDKFGQPKGFAYVEFLETEAIQEALQLNESELHGRQIKLAAKLQQQEQANTLFFARIDREETRIWKWLAQLGNCGQNEMQGYFRTKHHPQSNCRVSWLPPPPGVLKLNFDGSLGGEKAAAGLIIRDHNARLLWANGTPICCCSVPYVELVVVWEGIKRAVQQ
ncbi:hypothetical protein COCNU_scaffold001962G000060 [Cocos nucifera]|nr:hypothetical protein [Cocos nucifera]